MASKTIKKEHLTEVVIFVVGILLVSTAALIVGIVDSPKANFSPISTEYCIEVGDDNCDGVITPEESGWKCVPPNGGPLMC